MLRANAWQINQNVLNRRQATFELMHSEGGGIDYKCNYFQFYYLTVPLQSAAASTNNVFVM